MPSAPRWRRCRLAVKYMVPVILLSDGYIANGSEPWLLPKIEDLPDLRTDFWTDAENFLPYRPRRRDPRSALGDSRDAGPRAPHRWSREGGRHRQRLVRRREPREDDASRADKVAGIANDIAGSRFDGRRRASSSCWAGAARSGRSPARSTWRSAEGLEVSRCPPAAYQSVPEELGRRARPLRACARTRDEHGAARVPCCRGR